MIAGHFAVAAAVKVKTPKVPLWALMVSTQLLEIAFIPLYVAGVERIELIDGGGYGKALIHADFSHSLFGAILLAILSGLLAWRFWGRQGGGAVAFLVFSHWLLDFIVHRGDMAIIMGNIGQFPLVGLGLWELPMISRIVEILLILTGSIFYYKSIVPGTKGKLKRRALAASGLMSVLLILSLVI